MKHISKKCWHIGITLVILMILVFCTLFFIFHKKENTYEPLIANDGSCKIYFPTNITYQCNQNNEFIFDLCCQEDEMFFYATKIPKSRQIDLSLMVKHDKETYLKEKQNIREDSGIFSSRLQNYNVEEYHFVYTDSSYGKDFYCNDCCNQLY